MRIQELLFDHDIDFKIKGKNIKRNHIGIQCPFCHDKSTHCNIKKNNGNFSCFICGEYGNVQTLIAEILTLPRKEAINIISQYGGISGDSLFNPPSRLAKPETISWNTVIPSLSNTFQKPFKNYLKNRNFDPEYLQWKYNLSSPLIYNLGDWKYRILIPYFHKKQIVTYSGRTISKNAELKYYHLSEKNCLKTPKEVLYGLDNCSSKNIALVEGVTDVWAIGDSAVALSGKQLTSEQEILLLNHNPQKVFIILDPDAIEQANQIANRLKNFCKVEILFLKKGDPADLPVKCLNEIRWLMK